MLLAVDPPASAGGSGAPHTIECRMRVPKQVTIGSPVPLAFELVSRAPRPLHVLTWNTPLEGWFGRYLRVWTDEREVPYRGPQVKRGAPDPGDYANLAPGKVVRAVVDLSQVYALTLPGRYRVAFDGVLHDVTNTRPSANRTPYALNCPEAEFDMIARDPSR